MTYRIRAIEVLEDRAYRVTFDTQDSISTITLKCTVEEHAGIRGVVPEPADMFMSGEIDARAVSAAVTAFDDARRG